MCIRDSTDTESDANACVLSERACTHVSVTLVCRDGKCIIRHETLSTFNPRVKLKSNCINKNKYKNVRHTKSHQLNNSSNTLKIPYTNTNTMDGRIKLTVAKSCDQTLLPLLVKL